MSPLFVVELVASPADATEIPAAIRAGRAACLALGVVSESGVVQLILRVDAATAEAAAVDAAAQLRAVAPGIEIEQLHVTPAGSLPAPVERESPLH
jgi:hypothetical protein